MDGIAELSPRARSLPDLVRALVDAPPTFPELDRGAKVVTTGVGGSAAPARYLAWLLREALGVDARFHHLSRFVEGAPPGDALVVFSQYLSPNARIAIRRAGTYGRACVFTSSSAAVEGAPSSVARVTLPPPSEGGTLVRIVGRLTDDYDQDGTPVFRASYYRHWPRGFFVTTADREHMRR